MASFSAVVAGNPTLASDLNQFVNAGNGAAPATFGAYPNTGFMGKLCVVVNGTPTLVSVFGGTTDPRTIGGITVNDGDYWWQG